MTHTKPELEPATVLRRQIDRLVDGMSEARVAFFLEQPDALKHVFEGGVHGYFQKARIELPPSGRTKYDMKDAAGWKALEEGRVAVSLLTRATTVDYRTPRDQAMTAGGVFDDPDDLEDLEDMMERRKILRAGGTVVRRLKRLWFDGDCSHAELEGVIRLMGWKKADARSLLAWSDPHRHELDPDETVGASWMPLLKRDSRSIRLTSGLVRVRDQRNTYYHFKREDAGEDPARRIFDQNHSFLVEV